MGEPPSGLPLLQSVAGDTTRGEVSGTFTYTRGGGDTTRGEVSGTFTYTRGGGDTTRGGGGVSGTFTYIWLL